MGESVGIEIRKEQFAYCCDFGLSMEMKVKINIKYVLNWLW